jgi:ribosome-associated heat shock protein Hsp15
VTVDGHAVRKPAHTVRAGQLLAIELGPVRRTVMVRDIGARRGPAAEARTLYDEPRPPKRLAPGDARVPLHRTPRHP